MVGALVGVTDNDPKFWCLMPNARCCLTIKSLFSDGKLWKICEFCEMSDRVQNCVTESDKTEIKDT